MAAGPDLVVLDLEDAVVPEAKDEARAHVVDWLAKGGSAAVRINAGGEVAAQDAAALADLPVTVMGPKAEDPAAPMALCARLHPDSTLLALVETAAGVLAAPAITAVEGVSRLVLGTFDLTAQLGVSPDDRDAFRPSDDEVDWAKRIVDAAAGGGAVLLDGKMVDKPVVDRAAGAGGRGGRVGPSIGSTAHVCHVGQHGCSADVPPGRGPAPRQSAAAAGLRAPVPRDAAGHHRR